MKKNLFMVAAVAIAMVACNKEELNTPSDNQSHLSSVKFTAYTDITKTVLDNDDYTVSWEVDDAISINGAKFSTKEAGTPAIFDHVAGIFDEKAESFDAVYPYSAGTSFTSVTIPSEQTINAGGFPTEGVVSVASSTTTSLSFKNVTSLLKFQVPEFAETITSVTITSDEYLAGEVSINYSNGEPTWAAKNATKEITVKGNFNVGEAYYVSVLPSEQHTFTVRINGYLSKKSTKDSKVTRSAIMDMATLPAPVESDWGIVGEANDWTIDSPMVMYKDVDDNILIRNFTGGAFKFVKGTSWDINRGIRSRDESSPTKREWNLCGTKNITIDSGYYDIYFNPGYGVFNYVDKGTDVDNYVPSGKPIYLQVREWANADAYFEAWVWGSTQADAWYKFAMVGEKDNTHYVMYVPTDATGVKILRKDPKSESFGWDSWNNSGDQTIPTGKNMFIENGWDTYSWGTYTK